MKKIALLIVVIAMIIVMSVGLTACNSATTQGQLANLLHDHNHEKFVYNVHAEDVGGEEFAGYNGTYVVTLDAYDKDSSVPFGDKTLTNVQEGVLVRSTLTVGTTVIEMGCYFNLIGGSSFMTPAETFRLETVDGNVTYDMYGTYNGATLNYTQKINGVESSGNISTKTTYYDNNEWHQSLRTITTFSTGFSFSFSVPAIGENEGEFATLQSTISQAVYVKTPYTESVESLKEKGINCYEMKVSRTTEVAGMGHTLYYAVDDIKDAGWGMKNVLVKIVEPFKLDGAIYAMVYELVSAELA